MCIVCNTIISCRRDKRILTSYCSERGFSWRVFKASSVFEKSKEPIGPASFWDFVIFCTELSCIFSVECDVQKSSLRKH